MREIEIKAKIENLESIHSALQQQGVALSEPVSHHDVVWGVPGKVRGNNSPWLRLRTERKGDAERYLFTLKRSMTGQLDSLEYETEVDNPEAVQGIVKELGFVLYSDITKTRRKAHLDDKEICLDSVDGLGDFIELEKLTSDDADYQAVEDELWTIMRSFGISRENEVTIGYDVMINRKLGKE